jgi:hypothetical protein
MFHDKAIDSQANKCNITATFQEVNSDGPYVTQAKLYHRQLYHFLLYFYAISNIKNRLF